jgi:hypothetical protein
LYLLPAAIGLGLKIAILVTEVAVVSTTQYIDEAATAHDIAIQVRLPV